jgi:hypothetical protein
MFRQFSGFSCRESHIPIAGGASGNRNRQAEITCAGISSVLQKTAVAAGQRRIEPASPAAGTSVPLAA